MHWLIAMAVLAAQQVSDKKDLYPKISELILGAIAFGILFVFMAKWVLPRLNQTLEARRGKIQGDLEKAEQARADADKLLADYREQLAGARADANRIVEEARQTAEALREDLSKKAEDEARGIVARASRGMPSCTRARIVSGRRERSAIRPKMKLPSERPKRNVVSMAVNA